MRSRATGYQGSKATGVDPAEGGFSAQYSLRRAADLWLSDGRARGWSEHTLRDRRYLLNRLVWWLENEAETEATLGALTRARLRAFLAYARLGPENGAGRYGCGDRPSARREVRPATLRNYFGELRAFTRFCVAEGLLAEAPMENLPPPRVPDEQVQPLTTEQVQALLDGARRSCAPERDLALVILLVDTGLRASEACSLAVGDVDRGAGELTVTGKGKKRRRVYLGVAARRALWRYMEAARCGAAKGEPLFVSTGGHTAGSGLTHYGLYQIIARAGRLGGVSGVRCSPHTLRHTFAVNFLRGGGDLFHLQQLMGHTGLTVLRRYVALAEADLAQAHRQASPADRLKLK